MSRPTRERAILDAGSKALSSDPVARQPDGSFGLVVELPEARLYALSEEHGHLDVSGCPRRPVVGDVVTLIPNHACGTANMHDHVAVHRRGVLEGIWRVAARGALR